jgi:hypothetical protein
MLQLIKAFLSVLVMREKCFPLLAADSGRYIRRENIYLGRRAEIQA